MFSFAPHRWNAITLGATLDRSTMNDVKTGDDIRPVSSLIEALGRTSIGSHIEAVARHTLRHTGGGIRLLGIDQAGPRAVCFDPAHCCVYRLPISPIGTHPTKTILDWRSVADPRSWIDAHADDLVWVHPRYDGPYGTDATCWRYTVDTRASTPYV